MASFSFWQFFSLFCQNSAEELRMVMSSNPSILRADGKRTLATHRTDWVMSKTEPFHTQKSPPGSTPKNFFNAANPGRLSEGETLVEGTTNDTSSRNNAAFIAFLTFFKIEQDFYFFASTNNRFLSKHTHISAKWRSLKIISDRHRFGCCSRMQY